MTTPYRWLFFKTSIRIIMSTLLMALTTCSTRHSTPCTATPYLPDHCSWFTNLTHLRSALCAVCWRELGIPSLLHSTSSSLPSPIVPRCSSGLRRFLWRLIKPPAPSNAGVKWFTANWNKELQAQPIKPISLLHRHPALRMLWYWS